MSDRITSTETGSFFFEPLQFHLEPANLLVQLRLHSLGIYRSRLGAVAEDALRSCEQLLLPTVDQCRIHVELDRQLIDGPIFPQSSHGHLGLEGCRIALTLPCHGSPFPGSPV